MVACGNPCTNSNGMAMIDVYEANRRMKASNVTDRVANRVERRINRQVKRASRQGYSGLVGYNWPQGTRSDVKDEVQQRFQGRGFVFVQQAGNKYRVSWALED